MRNTSQILRTKGGLHLVQKSCCERETCIFEGLGFFQLARMDPKRKGEREEMRLQSEPM